MKQRRRRKLSNVEALLRKFEPSDDIQHTLSARDRLFLRRGRAERRKRSLSLDMRQRIQSFGERQVDDVAVTEQGTRSARARSQPADRRRSPTGPCSEAAERVDESVRAVPRPRDTAKANQPELGSKFVLEGDSVAPMVGSSAVPIKSEPHDEEAPKATVAITDPKKVIQVTSKSVVVEDNAQDVKNDMKDSKSPLPPAPAHQTPDSASEKPKDAAADAHQRLQDCVSNSDEKTVTRAESSKSRLNRPSHHEIKGLSKADGTKPVHIIPIDESSRQQRSRLLSNGFIISAPPDPETPKMSVAAPSTAWAADCDPIGDRKRLTLPRQGSSETSNREGLVTLGSSASVGAKDGRVGISVDSRSDQEVENEWTKLNKAHETLSKQLLSGKPNAPDALVVVARLEELVVDMDLCRKAMLARGMSAAADGDSMYAPPSACQSVSTTFVDTASYTPVEAVPADPRAEAAMKAQVKGVSDALSTLTRGADARPHDSPSRIARDMARLSKWITMHKNWSHWQRRHARKLRERIRKGIPPQLRGWVWPRLVGASDRRSRNPYLYRGLLTQKLPVELRRTIEVDCPRTFPKLPYFRPRGNGGASPGLDTMREVLCAYAAFDHKVGYCQGMNFVVANLILSMGLFTPQEMFWTLERLCNAKQLYLKGLYMPGFPLLHEFSYVLDELMRAKLPKLHLHFARAGASLPFGCIGLFAPRWFVSLWAVAPRNCSLRVWDILLSEGVKILFRVSLYVLGQLQARLLRLGDDSLFVELSQLQSSEHLAQFRFWDDEDAFIKGVFRIRLSGATVARLRGAYRARRATVAQLQSRRRARERASEGKRCVAAGGSSV